MINIILVVTMVGLFSLVRLLKRTSDGLSLPWIGIATVAMVFHIQYKVTVHVQGFIHPHHNNNLNQKNQQRHDNHCHPWILEGNNNIVGHLTLATSNDYSVSPFGVSRIKNIVTLFYQQSTTDVEIIPNTDPDRKWNGKGSRKKRSWEDYYPKLQHFYQQNGHSNVTKGYDEDLFDWTTSLRKSYTMSRKHVLSDTQLQALADVDFSWLWSSIDSSEEDIHKNNNINNNKGREDIVGRRRRRRRRRQETATWREYFPKLQAFHRRHGHCNVTAKVDPDLYRWVDSLRRNNRYGGRESTAVSASLGSNGLPTSDRPRTRGLSEEKFQSLQDLGFTWYIRGPIAATTREKKTTKQRQQRRTWKEYFPQLQAFHRQNGHCNVTMQDDPELFKWVKSMRRNYQYQVAGGGGPYMNSTQALSSPGMSRSQRPKFSDEKLQALKDLDFPLYARAKKRVDNNLHKSTNTAISMLPNYRTWKEFFPKLQTFHRQNGHSYVTMQDDPELFKWVESTRRNYQYQVTGGVSTCINSTKALSSPGMSTSQRHSLSDEKLQALKDLDFPWFIYDTSCRQWKTPTWEEYFARLQQQQKKATKRRRVRRWKEYFPQLQAFHRQNGHCYVTMQDDPELFKWIQSTRKNYRYQVADGVGTCLNSTKALSSPGMSRSRRHSLSDEKLQALKDLHFPWYSPAKKRVEDNLNKSANTAISMHLIYRTWKEFFPKLQTFYQQHGHCNVTVQDDEELFIWTESLRTQCRSQILEDKGKSRKWQRRRGLRLSDDRLKELRDINFEWNAGDDCSGSGNEIQLSNREEMIARLTAFQQNHGHANVEVHDDPELHWWTKNLTMTGTPRIEIWEARYRELREFYNEHGHCRVNSKKNPRLGNFVKEQRRQYRHLLSGKETTLTPDRTEALERLSFTWGKGQEERWKERFEELQTFRKEHGHSSVPQRYSENPELGRWVDNQRTFKEALKPERIARLNATQFTWNVKERQWRAMLARLRDYEERQGNLLIDGPDIDDYRLRRWLIEQRHFYKTSQINQDRVEALESIPGFAESVRRSKYVTKNDWSQLLSAIRQKGISPKAKRHWFDGVNPLQDEVKSVWTDDELLALWNEEEDEDEEDDYGDDYFEDEESRLFVRK